MKFYLLTGVFIFVFSSLFAQKRYTIGLDLSYGVSETTYPAFQKEEKNEGLQRAANLFGRFGYYLNTKTEATIGFGLLTTSDANAYVGIHFVGEDVLFEHNVNQYLVLPIGARFHFGSFYVHPEFGIGRVVNRRTQQTLITLLPDGSSGSISDFNPSEELFNPISYPVFLGFGNEMSVGKIKIILGVKGYYSLNKMSDILTGATHYYGVGIVTGVKF